VKHCKEADLGAQVLGVSRDGAQGLGRSPEQNVIDDLLVLQGNGGDGLRYGEDDMKILSVEKLGSTVFQPLGARQRLALWAVAITAGNGARTISCRDRHCPKCQALANLQPSPLARQASDHVTLPARRSSAHRSEAPRRGFVQSGFK
jgi:hypothetical protein